MSEPHTQLKARLVALGLTQASLARRMRELGDDRTEKTILRSIQRMVSGDARISGEMRALLGLMEQQDNGQSRAVVSCGGCLHR